MKTDDNGNILTATRTEIIRHYYAGDLKDLFTLDEYIALLRYQGVKIIDADNQDQNQGGA